MKVQILLWFVALCSISDQGLGQVVMPDSAQNAYLSSTPSGYRFTYQKDGTPKEVIAYGTNVRYTYSEFGHFSEVSFDVHPFFEDQQFRVYTEDTLVGSDWITTSLSRRDGQVSGISTHFTRQTRDSVNADLRRSSERIYQIDTFSGFWLSVIEISRNGDRFDTMITQGSQVIYDTMGRLIAQRSRYEARDFIYNAKGQLDSVIVYWGLADSSYRLTYLFTEIDTFDRKAWQPILRTVNFTTIYPNLGVKSAKFHEWDSTGWKYYQTLKQGFDNQGRRTFYEDRDQRLLTDYFPEGGFRTSRNEWPRDGRVQFQTSRVRTYDGNRIISQCDTSIDVSASWPPDTSKKHRNTWTFFYNTATVKDLSGSSMDSKGFMILRSQPNLNILPDQTNVTLFSAGGQQTFRGTWEKLTSSLPATGVYFLSVAEQFGVKQFKLLVTP